MSTLALYPFRFRDPLTGKWVRARHKMQVPELQRSYAEWEIAGGPEIDWQRIVPLGNTRSCNLSITPTGLRALAPPRAH